MVKDFVVVVVVVFCFELFSVSLVRCFCRLLLHLCSSVLPQPAAPVPGSISPSPDYPSVPHNPPVEHDALCMPHLVFTVFLVLLGKFLLPYQHYCLIL